MENQTKVTSKQFALNALDFLKSGVVAVIMAVLTVVETSVEAGNFHFDWPTIGKIAGGAAVAYLAKNFAEKPTIQTTITNTQVDQAKTSGVIPAQPAIDTTQTGK